jgi:hypothetical protein
VVVAGDWTTICDDKFSSNVAQHQCADNCFISQLGIRLEPHQGGGDDTGVNGLAAACTCFHRSP